MVLLHNYNMLKFNLLAFSEDPIHPSEEIYFSHGQSDRFFKVK